MKRYINYRIIRAHPRAWPVVDLTHTHTMFSSHQGASKCSALRPTKNKNVACKLADVIAHLASYNLQSRIGPHRSCGCCCKPSLRAMGERTGADRPCGFAAYG